METKFENRVTFTKKVIYEYLMAASKKAGTIFAIVTGSFFIILAIAQYNMGYIALTIESLSFAVIFFCYPIIICKFLATRYYEQQKLINNGNEMQKTVKFSDNINIISANGAKTSFSYTQIKHIYESKNLIILKVKHKVLIILSKSNFIVGDLNSFRIFISKECTGARLK
mgnify:CR=1 FL=1